MLRLALLAIALAFLVGLIAGLSRAVFVVFRRDSPCFRKSKELGFFAPAILLLIACVMMMLPWGEADVGDEAAVELLWRAMLLYFVAWTVIGRRVQGAIEGLVSRQIEGRKV